MFIETHMMKGAHMFKVSVTGSGLAIETRFFDNRDDAIIYARARESAIARLKTGSRVVIHW